MGLGLNWSVSEGFPTYYYGLTTHERKKVRVKDLNHNM